MCDMLDWDFALFILPSSHIIMSDKLDWDFALFILPSSHIIMSDKLDWDFALFEFLHHKTLCVTCWTGTLPCSFCLHLI